MRKDFLQQNSCALETTDHPSFELAENMQGTEDNVILTPVVLLTESNLGTISKNESSSFVFVSKKEIRKKRRKRKYRKKGTNISTTIIEPNYLTRILVTNNSITTPNYSSPSLTNNNMVHLKRIRKLRRRKLKLNSTIPINNLNITNNPTVKINIETQFTKYKDEHDSLENNTVLYDPQSENLAYLVSPATVHPDQHSTDNTRSVFNVKNLHHMVKNRCNRYRIKNGGCSQVCNFVSFTKIKCSCFEGFFLIDNHHTCVDINECDRNNGGCQYYCNNTLGSYKCYCPLGLRLSDDLKSCEDINECLLRNGHGPCQDSCENTLGSYTCSCSNWKGTSLSQDGHSCEDLDECKKDNGGCSHICINAFSRVFCSCPGGMQMSSDWKSCQDINECELEDVRKTCQTVCINTDGSYKCLDLEDLQNDQASEDMACKLIIPPPKGYLTCTKRNSFSNTRREITMNSPGTVCKLICPTGYKKAGKYRVTCTKTGIWKGFQNANCLPALPPSLECPPNQLYNLKDGSKKLRIRLPFPQTEISWKYVKSRPEWAKKLSKTLLAGQHNISFFVKDPKTNLISNCSFVVVIKNRI